MKNYFCQQINKFDTWRKQRPILSFLLIFSICFLFVFSIMYLGLFRNDYKTLLGYYDGTDQLYPALYYYGDWLKGLFSNLIHGTLPTWSWDIGLGSDVITTLGYYVVGDPFALLAGIWPQSQIELLYSFIILAKMYCMGVAFFAYVHYLKRGWFESLLGSLLYAFCGFVVVFVSPMSLFGTAIIYLPLLLLGLEKIFRKEKPHFFVIMSFLSVLNNFYMLYMLVLLIVIYGIIRYLFEYRSTVKAFFATIGKCIGFFATGACMGAFLFLPMIKGFLSSCRVSNSSLLDAGLFYYPGYYKLFFTEFAIPGEGDNYTSLSFAAISFFALIILFITREKKYWQLRVGFIVLSAFMLIPIGGSIFNGFGYPVNRWMFGYAFLVSLITVVVLPKLYQLSKVKAGILAGCIVVYIGLCLWLKGLENIYIYMGLGFMLIVLSILFFFGKTQYVRFTKSALLVVTCIYLGLNGFIVYDKNFLEMSNVYNKLDQVRTSYETGLGKTASYLSDDDNFYRSVASSLINDSLVTPYHSTVGYWSLQDKDIYDFYVDQDIGLHFVHYFGGFGNDVYLNTLLSAKYQITEKGVSMFGYEKVETPEGYSGIVHENQYVLPLGFTYDSIMYRSEYDKLNTMDKKNTLLSSLILEDNASSNGLTEKSSSDINSLPEAAYTFEESNESTIISDNEITVGGNGEVLLNVNIPKGKTIYVQFKNLHLDTTRYVTVVNGEQESMFHYLNPDWLYYYGNHDYLVSLGEATEDVMQIKLAVGSGTMTFDDINVYAVDMNEEYLPNVQARAQDKFESLTVEDTKVEGNITVDQDKILFFSIPYTEGWSATVNGETVEVEKANVGFMAIPITEGENHVVLKYRTPWLLPGILISGVTFVTYITVVIVLRVKRKHKLK